MTYNLTMGSPRKGPQTNYNNKNNNKHDKSNYNDDKIKKNKSL